MANRMTAVVIRTVWSSRSRCERIPGPYGRDIRQAALSGVRVLFGYGGSKRSFQVPWWLIAVKREPRTGQERVTAPQNEAEQVALWALSALLERELREPFDLRSADLVSEARARLTPSE
jgi:hypothetical protein